MNNKGLCFRCEYRAQFLESKRQPKYECGEVNSAVGGCYMFQPVKPISIKPKNGDGRPITLNILSARVERVEENVELKLEAKNGLNGTLIYWMPEKE